MLRLSSGDITALCRAGHVLSTPLEYETLDAWRAAANREVLALMGADSAGFLMPVDDAAPMVSNEHSPEALAPFPELLPPDLSDGTPIWSRMIALGTSTTATGYGTDLHRYLASPYYNEYALPAGAADTIALTISLDGVRSPMGAASLHVWHATRRPGSPGDREIALLTLLSPAFRAGVASWIQFQSARSSLVGSIDTLGQAVLVCDPTGRVEHATPALVEILGRDPDGRDILARMRTLAGSGIAKPDGSGLAASVSVRTTSSSYSLHRCEHTAPGGAALVLVSLQLDVQDPSSTLAIPSRFGLTPAEARVASLLARGLRNLAIANALGISPHTAKRHTERVMQKLGAGSRSEVATRLNG